METADVNHKSMKETIEIPKQEFGHAKALAFNAYSIELWVPHEIFLTWWSFAAFWVKVFFILKIEERVEHNWKRGHGNVVQLINEGLVERLSGKHGFETKVELSCDVENIFVESVQNEIRVPAIGLATVYKHQSLKELELTNRVISASSGLLAFFSKNTDSDMCLKNHVYVICPVTDRERYFLRESLFYQIYNVGFLFWWYSTG